MTGTAAADDRTTADEQRPDLRSALAAVVAELDVPSGPATDAGVVRAATLGGEDRTRVNPAAKPHASIVVVELVDKYDDSFGSCTGTIVGPRAVLTAAHCLADPLLEFLDFDHVRVVPGKNGFDEPWGSQTSKQWLIPAEFKNPGSSLDELRHDYALILLPDRSMTDRTGTIPGGLAAVPDQVFRDPSLRFAVVGYPFDCNDRACGEEAHGSLYGQGAFAWLAPTSFVWASPDFLHHDADLYGGVSGGPLLRTADLALMGITTSMGTLLDRSVRITQPMLDRMSAWCQQNGCSLNLAPAPQTPDRPHRAVTMALATDSATGVCVIERSFLEAFAAASAEWELALLDAMAPIIANDFNPESPEWRNRFEQAFRALESATNRLLALQPPDARFTAYHAEVDEGVKDLFSVVQLLKRAVDENRADELEAMFSLLVEAEEHLESAMTLYPGLDANCLAPADSPFGPPPPSGGR